MYNNKINFKVEGLNYDDGNANVTINSINIQCEAPNIDAIFNSIDDTFGISKCVNNKPAKASKKRKCLWSCTISKDAYKILSNRDIDKDMKYVYGHFGIPYELPRWEEVILSAIYDGTLNCEYKSRYNLISTRKFKSLLNKPIYLQLYVYDDCYKVKIYEE